MDGGLRPSMQYRDLDGQGVGWKKSAPDLPTRFWSSAPSLGGGGGGEHGRSVAMVYRNNIILSVKPVQQQ